MDDPDDDDDCVRLDTEDDTVDGTVARERLGVLVLIRAEGVSIRRNNSGVIFVVFVLVRDEEEKEGLLEIIVCQPGFGTDNIPVDRKVELR